MAGLYGHRFVFVHIPKCGGKWVRRALAASGYTFNRDLSDGHAPAPGIGNPDWTAFCFIRHPATWLASWWAYCERSEWMNKDRLPETFDRTKPFDRMVWDAASIDHNSGFASWAYQLEYYYPGFVGKFFAPYMRSVHFVGRQETLKSDLEAVIGPVPDIPPLNVGDNVPEIPEDVWEIVARNEPLEKLGYAKAKEVVLQEGYESLQQAI